uniref:Uncharacterized protein LOC104216327 n=1 Tax=Nicotiana sylvestris TaxID=4096 RepID=A0A1U7VIB9_NICSY|nr:PREDICTED: uncharacterized protein LOC104216327 [Nicotiana sylvestris]
MSEREALPPLFKQKSWYPDMLREEAWLKRKGNYRTKLADRRRSKSVTDDDLEQLRACFAYRNLLCFGGNWSRTYTCCAENFS